MAGQVKSDTSGGHADESVLNIPPSDSVCDVSIIDTTSKFVLPAAAFVSPVQKGHETLNMPAFAFLITNRESKKSILFDLGVRKDWWNLSPAVRGSLKAGVKGIRVEKSITEVLKEGGIDGQSISGVVLSHGHFDHTGDLSLFPSSVTVTVGPGFKEKMIPPYPTNPDGHMLETDFKFVSSLTSDHER